MDKFILAIDQSTQGTKAILFDEDAKIVAKEYLPHHQIIDQNGWIEHDLDEIYQNVITTVKNLLSSSGINKNDINAVGICNQRETTACWTDDGNSFCNAIVWQCSRAKEICKELENKGYGKIVKEKTGIALSPYFVACKLAWILKYVENANQFMREGKLRFGTIDTYLVYRLTHGKKYATDYSNASRTQLFDIRNQCWDEELCNIFGINFSMLPEVLSSDFAFGETDFEGILDKPISIHAVLGDSHAALYSQGCIEKGMTKTTYGTGSSVMMNVGYEHKNAEFGLTSTIAWCINDKVTYALEGNINYSGGVISWLKDDIKLIGSSNETEMLAYSANQNDDTYLVPAFSGLGAPYWNNGARAIICNISRSTGKNEIVKAALESIAYQINDILQLMEKTSNSDIKELKVDGGATKNRYLMQFQSDISNVSIIVSNSEEMSAAGVAILAGQADGLYDRKVGLSNESKKIYHPVMDEAFRNKKTNGWNVAIQMINRSKED